MSQIWTRDVASTRCSTEPPERMEHVILVMKLNSFPVINQTVLFAHKHTERMRYCPQSNSVKRWKHLSRGSNLFRRRTTKPLERHGRINLQGPKLRPETSELGTSERQHVAITVSQRIPPLISDTFFNSLSICYVSGPLSSSWGWELSHTQKRHFEAHCVLGQW